jgi:hypothetical protein
MAREKQKETAAADPKVLVAMIDYIIPEADSLSKVAALHLREAKALLRREIARLSSTPPRPR